MTHRTRAHRTEKIALLESLESRVLFSAGHLSTLTRRPVIKKRPRSQPIPPGVVAAPSTGVTPNASSFVGQGFTPAQIRHAYGFDQITFGSVVGDGTGQTIAIIDAFNDPNIIADLAAFDAAFGIAAPPNFTVMAQDGSSNLPPNAPSGGWGIEITLDVEWAHAIAPGANIILVEATDNQSSNLNAAIATARLLPGVSVLSMSYGSAETFTENANDNTFFTTPAGHNGITYVAATGDAGPPGDYPAYSKNVVAVGGTTLTLNANNTISSESAWGGSGGGISTFQNGLPSYQVGLITQSNTKRTIPDVVINGDPGTGVPIYDSFDFPGDSWHKYGGTSLSAPLFAGLVAIADQGRASVGLTSLDSGTQTLPMLYSLPASDFNDITSGSINQANGNLTFSAAPGYDLASGRGSPIANKVVFGLMGTASNTGTISGTVFQANNSDGALNNSGTPLANTTVYIDSNNNGIFDPSTLVTASATPNLGIPDSNKTGVTSNITISGTTSSITNITVNLNITHNRDSDLVVYLIAPNGTQIALANAAGGSGHNYSNTTFSDFATTSINAGTAPFTNGTFRPTLDALADFNGFSANGVWQLRVADTVSGTVGTLNSWTLNVTTGDLYSTTTNANGTYSFNNLLTSGSYTVRDVTPAGFAQTVSTIPSLFSNVTNQNITTFPPIFNSSNNTSSYFVNVADSNNLQIFNSATPSGSSYTVPLSSALGLTFNLTGSNNKVIISFANFNPIPVGNITVNATTASSEELQVLGQYTTQAFTLINTQVGPTAGGPVILFNNLPTLTLGDSTTTLASDLTSLQNLNLNSDETFNFI